MISRTIFCSAQAPMMRLARMGPMPVTSCSRSGSTSITSNTFSPTQARWYLFMPCTVAAGNQAMWRAGIDHETYARVDGAWMFRHKRSEPLMSVRFETGWAPDAFRVTRLPEHRLGG
jgi:hypothetical protein